MTGPARIFHRFRSACDEITEQIFLCRGQENKILGSQELFSKSRGVRKKTEQGGQKGGFRDVALDVGREPEVGSLKPVPGYSFAKN